MKTHSRSWISESPLSKSFASEGVRRFWTLLCYEDDPGPVGGGHFLTRFWRERAILLLRILGAISFLLTQPYTLPPGSTNSAALWIWAAIYLPVHVALFAFKRVLNSVRFEEPLTSLQSVADVISALWLVSMSYAYHSFSVLLFILGVLDAAYFICFSLWILVIVVALILFAVYIFISEQSHLLSTGVMAGCITVILRLLRGSQVAASRETKQQLRIMEQGRHEAELVSTRLAQLHEGTKCGITVLRLDGTIEYWNDMHERIYADDRARERKQKSFPCYYVFHDATRPCRWCPLPWKRRIHTTSSDRDIPSVFPKCDWSIDFSEHAALRVKLESEHLSCVSSQMRAGKEKEDTFHLFQIHFGAITHNSIITNIVETVTEVTETVLEMPFLSDAQHNGHVLPTGLLPISIVTPDKKTVIAINKAKRDRSPYREHINEYLHISCKECYGIGSTYKCTSCPVDTARMTGSVAKRLTLHPSPALVTAVPIFGPTLTPDGPAADVRAVLEFVNDVSDLKFVEETGGHLNELVSENEVFRAGLKALRKLAKAQRCVLIEFREAHTVIVIRSAAGYSKPYDIKCVPVAKTVLTNKQVVFIDQLECEDSLGVELKRFAAKRHLGPAALLPLLNRRRDLVGIVCLERVKDRKTFDEEQVLYCLVLAGHWAAALARAQEFETRKRFIEAISETAEAFTVEAVSHRLVTSMSSLFSGGESLALYGTGEAMLRMKRAKVLAFSKEEDGSVARKSGRAPLRVGETVRLAGWLVEALQRSGCPNGPVEGGLACWPEEEAEPGDLGKCTLTVPMRDRGQDIFAFLVAENRFAEQGVAFPERTRLLVQLVGEVGAIILDRSVLVRQCVASYGHGLARPLQEARLPLSRIAETLQRTGLQLDDVEDLERRLHCTDLFLEAGRKTWALAIGCEGVLKLSRLKVRSILQLIELTEQDPTKSVVRRTLQEVKDGDVFDFLADESCAYVCISELLRNAIKYGTPGTSPDLKVLSADGILRVRVTNCGKLPSDWHEAGFKGGFRGRDHIRARIPGSGMGLWQVGTLLQAQPKAALDVYQGDGTVEFTLSFPVC